jgi:hypothetical protein
VSEAGLVKINEAVRDCLRACYDAPSALQQLALFVAALRNDPDWRDAEIDLVERGVIRMLRLMVRRSGSGDFEPLLREDPSSKTPGPSAAPQSTDLVRQSTTSDSLQS